MANDPNIEPLPMTPPRLAEDLRMLHGGELPEHLARLVLLRAERELAGAEVRRRNRFRLQKLAAAAAGVALFLLVARLVSNRPMPGSGRGAAVPAPVVKADPAYDVTGDGSVNILDAFRLARLLEGEGATGAWDANGDGRVDRADVDTIAMRAVRLEGAG